MTVCSTICSLLLALDDGSGLVLGHVGEQDLIEARVTLLLQCVCEGGEGGEGGEGLQWFDMHVIVFITLKAFK